MNQGTQSQCSVKTWTDRVGREVGSERRGHMYAYGQFVLMQSKNHHNIVLKNLFLNTSKNDGRDWGQEEEGTTEDEMAGWHRRLDGHEFE